MKLIHMIAIFVAVLFCSNAMCIPLPHTALSADHQQARHLSGVYHGYCEGCGIVQTEFVTKHGVISGHYFMHINDTIKVGTLTNVAIDDLGDVTATWTDVYGTGTVNFQFSYDQKSFSGTWNNEYKWIGSLL